MEILSIIYGNNTNLGNPYQVKMDYNIFDTKYAYIRQTTNWDFQGYFKCGFYFGMHKDTKPRELIPVFNESK